jgi:hypothetical protein
MRNISFRDIKLLKKTFSIEVGGFPMKKVLKAIMVVIMLLGIAFSILNFFSMELKAFFKRGVWVYVGVIGSALET